MSGSVEIQSPDRTPHSLASCVIHISKGYSESAHPEDKVTALSEQSDLEDDWENDPDNARNWSAKKKWAATAIVSFYTFIPPLASSMMAPGLPEVASKYGITNTTLIALTLSIFMIPYGLGVEMYGRTWVLHIGNFMSAAFSLGCAFAPTTGALIGFRFLSGISGSAPIAVGGGSIGDLFSERDRASAMALYNLGPLIGPIVGPIAGAFLAQSIGVKWVLIVVSIVCGVISVVTIPLLRETYAPVIRQRRAAKSGDRENTVSSHLAIVNGHGKLYYLWLNLSRPVTLLFGSFICFVLSLYMAFMYGIFYLMFTTFPEIFATTYHFSAGVGGLAYIGFLTATLFGARISDQIYKHLADKNGGIATPEMRIPALFFGSIFVPIGLLWYGWSAAAKVHWIMPIIDSGIFGFGMPTTSLPIQLYLVDSFTYAARAMSAVAMFNVLGLGGGSSILAALAVILGIPFPVWLYYKGEAMRARNPLTHASTIPKNSSKILIDEVVQHSLNN
ncbi:MFS general substrate transporter [Phlegmacium glaucopus]|nr:MFS general substrate transporter [Phlegmacium glaucopus]